jgi:hypothetical protein
LVLLVEVTTVPPDAHSLDEADRYLIGGTLAGLLGRLVTANPLKPYTTRGEQQQGIEVVLDRSWNRVRNGKDFGPMWRSLHAR